MQIKERVVTAMPEQPAIEVAVHMVTAHDSTYEGSTVPKWSELILDIGVEQEPRRQYTAPLTRAAGELIIDALHEALHPWSGKPIVQMLEDELDESYGTIMQAKGKGVEKEKGVALGLATAIAHMYNPYQPNIDTVREDAQSRWEATQES